MTKTNDALGELVAATRPSGFVDHVAFEERGGTNVVCVAGPLAELLARVGPDHVVDRDGIVVWFHRSAGFRHIVSAVADALERHIERHPWDPDVDGA